MSSLIMHLPFFPFVHEKQPRHISMFESAMLTSRISAPPDFMPSANKSARRSHTPFLRGFPLTIKAFIYFASAKTSEPVAILFLPQIASAENCESPPKDFTSAQFSVRVSPARATFVNFILFDAR